MSTITEPELTREEVAALIAEGRLGAQGANTAPGVKLALFYDRRLSDKENAAVCRSLRFVWA